jgi:hypothetical protein
MPDDMIAVVLCSSRGVSASGGCFCRAVSEGEGFQACFVDRVRGVLLCY